MQFNTELSQRAIDHIKAYPQNFDQNSWGKETTCGTAHCWYGWCMAFKGYNDISLYRDIERLSELALSIVGLHWNSFNFGRITDPDNDIEDIEYYHAKLAAGESIQFDRKGFDTDGFDVEGLDPTGFDRKGLDRNGYNRRGYNSDDYDCADFDEDGNILLVGIIPLPLSLPLPF